MNPLLQVKCLFDRHTPHRSTIHFDGEEYRSRCTECRQPIRRLKHRLWIRVELGKDDARATVPR